MIMAASPFTAKPDKAPPQLGKVFWLRLVGRHIWHRGIIEGGQGKIIVMTTCGAWIKPGHVGNWNDGDLKPASHIQICRKCKP